MILGSFLFCSYSTSNKNLFAIFKDHQIRVFILVLFTAVTLIFYFAYSFIDGNYIDKLLRVTFNTISIISGTGYVSDNFENWGNYASVLFLIDVHRWMCWFHNWWVKSVQISNTF